MFASKEKNVAKKSFQKPNILRRRSKAPNRKANISNIKESPEGIPLVTTTPRGKPNISDKLDNITLPETNDKTLTASNTVWELSLVDDCEDNTLKCQERDTLVCVNSNEPITDIKTAVIKDLDNALNIESFINSTGIKQNLPMPSVTTVSTEQKITQGNKKWCFDVTNNSKETNNYIIEEQLGVLEENLDSVIVVPPEPESNKDLKQVYKQVSTRTTPSQTIAVDCYSNRAVKYKCDQPSCNKGFWSEEKLRKHKNSHKRQVYRTPTQITYECPVKKIAEDGSEDKCPHTYEIRGELLKHLDEDHTLDEAQHRCEVCGRRFFWAMGLRAHASSLCARGGLVCGWPGCGRVFRLPCRLREHARAHTGDRPYLCRYPECGWAFRSASKLVRHARRHTDERQHACATCGRAFMRREHLRDHAARHHLAVARTAHVCTHPGCEVSFTNMSTLYMHMKKVHRKDEKLAVASISDNAPANEPGEDGDCVYLVSLPEDVVVEDESCSVSEVGAGGAGVAGGAGGAGSTAGADELWHAARTHCTWPLARAAHAHAIPALDDDVHVERTEGSVSDVYTVRSDLFLHGNGPIDEDSQQIVGAALSGEADALDADLCLIDPHPTIDLMQELMYEDGADESSFRVLLMNEELT